MKIRSHLLLLVAAAVLPLLAFAVGLTLYAWSQQRQSLELRQLERVRAMTIALDTELQAAIRVLRTLGLQLSPEAEGAQLAQAMRALVATQPLWSMLAVGEPGWERVTAVSAVGDTTTAPPIDARMREKILATELPAVSGVLSSGGRQVTQIGVPLMRDGRIERLMVVVVDQGAWLRFMSQYPTASGAILSLIDQDGRMIARTLDNDRWAGSAAPPVVMQKAADRVEGSYRGVGLEGQGLYFSHSRSVRWGWIVTTGVPSEAVDAAVRETGGIMLLIAGVLVALALLLAILIGRRIERPITALGGSAQALVHGEEIAPPQAGNIEEVAQLTEAFHEAGAMLLERRRALNEALKREQQARQEAEQASRAKDEFLAMLGHELRNPLNAITSAFAILQHGAAPAADGERAREIIGRQIGNLRELVDDLLDVARVTRGKIVLARHPVDLARIVRRTVRVMSASGRLGRHQLDVQCEEAWVMGDETRLEQVVANLLDNAAKYTPEGGRISVRAVPEGAEAVLEVRDDGMGIAPDLMPRIFELFSQGERTLDRSQGGLGLGLALVRQLVELHGGTVSASSEGVGRGARFEVRIPLEAAPQPAAAPVPTEAQEPKPLRILIVEDNPDGRETLAMMLAMQGNEVHEAEDGPAGVDRALELRPDAAVVDIGLPGFDGYEVARRVRATEPGRSIRLIALTGYGQEDDRQNALRAGFDWFLVKPANLQLLNEILASIQRLGRGPSRAPA